MKRCPNCAAEVEDNYDVCWNCQYSFEGHKVLSDSDYTLICPNCNTPTPSTFRFCTNCKFDLNEVKKETETEEEDDAESTWPQKIDCPRCKVRMQYLGNFNFHEGTRYGALGNMFELLVNKASFDLYHCPKCDKVEFFIPK